MAPIQAKSVTVRIAVCSTAIIAWFVLTGNAGAVILTADLHQADNPTPTATPFPLESLPQINSVDENIPPDIAASMDQIQQQVIQVRGLIPTTRLPRILLSISDHAANVQAGEFGYQDEDDTSGESAYLDALDILDSSNNLQQIYYQMFTEGIVGYYDNFTREMYVVVTDSFGVNDQLTYAHEYTHALQDQNFDFRNKLNYTDYYCTQLPDRCAAVQALVEGDATLTEQVWLYANYVGAAAPGTVQTYDFSGSGSSEYFYDDLYFPYQYGLNFVNQLYTRGGWETVNAAYTQLPATTEQIMHPEKYPAENALPVELPPTLFKAIPSGYTGKGQLTMGEWKLFLALVSANSTDSSIATDAALNAAAGWGGDRYQVYFNNSNDKTIFVQTLVWDSQADADEFFSLFRTYGAVRWPVTEETNRGDYSAWHADDEFAAIWQNGLQTFWVIAPDSQIRTEILSSAGMEP